MVTGDGGTAAEADRAPGDGGARRATRREWAGLALLVLPMLALATDLTVLFFALPTLSADLDASTSEGLWLVHVYGFLIAGFLVAMGRLGDRIGPRRLLLIGASAFAVLSTVAAFSSSAEMLIVSRALLGIAGATLMPSLFSLLRTMFRDDRQRRTAIAVMFSAFSVGGAIGPLLGGALLELFWWGSVFLVSVPPMVLLVLAGPKLLPERAERNAAPLDVVSVALSVVGMLAVVYGLQELAAGTEAAAEAVWSDLAIAAGGALVLAGFVRRQLRLRNPLFDLTLLADRRVAVPLVSLLLVGIGVVGAFYLFTQYLQWVAGLSPLRAGLWTLPYIVVNVVGAMLAPALTGRLRPPVVVAGGLAIVVVGALLLAAVVDPDRSLWRVVGTLAVVGFGQGVAMALLSDLLISSAPPEKTGSVAAVQEVGGELGSALGIAASGAVGAVVYRSTLPDAPPAGVPETAVEAARSSVHEGVAAGEAHAVSSPGLLDAVHAAVAQGLEVYAAVGAGLAATAAALVAGMLVRGGWTSDAADGGPVSDGVAVDPEPGHARPASPTA